MKCFDAADELVIENLSPETEYIFYIRAKNDVGVGERTQAKATTTAISQYRTSLSRITLILLIISTYTSM